MQNHDVQEELWPLVGTQQGIWFAQQVMPNPAEFNVAHYTEIFGDIDQAQFAKAVNAGIAAADSLHCRYVENDGEIKQQFSRPSVAIDALEILDFSQAASPHDAAVAWMKEDLATTVDLQSEAPRYRHCLIDVGEDGAPKWLWYQRYHHLDVDGFSFHGITEHIIREYNHAKHATGGPAPFGAFTAVIAEHQQFKESAQYQKAQQFWQDYAGALPEIPSLVTGGRRHDAIGVEKYSIDLAGGAWLSREGNNILPSEFAMSLVFAYLHRVTGNNHLCVGFPLMRRIGRAAGAAGAVVNVLPLSLSLDPGMTIAEVAALMNRSIRDIRRHQMYDAEQIQRDLGKVGQPLYGPVLNFKPFADNIDLAGIPGKTHILSAGPIDEIEFSPALAPNAENQNAKNDHAKNPNVKSHNALSLTLTANAAKYSPRALALHARRFAYMVEQIAANPDVALSDLALVPPGEQADIAQWSQGPALDITEDQTVLDVFARQVRLKPDTVALNFAQQSWTFAALSQAIEARAQQLMALGAGQGTIVGVALPRGPQTMITMLAVLRCGAVYLPIDLDYPQERIETILEQAQPWGVIVEEVEGLEWRSLARCITLTELVNCNATCRSGPDIDPSDVAYIVFTSGSTGKPKGVMNTHGALLNLLHSHQNSVFAKAIRQIAEKRQCAEGEVQVRAAHTTSFSFDASWEQVIWMLCGHTLYLYDDEKRKDAYELVDRVQQDQIDALDLPPSLFSQMLDSGLMDAGHVPALVLIGSEAVPEKLWSRVQAFPELLVENFYGPTEFTVDAVSAPLTADGTPVIGRPILNARAYVLDPQLAQVPVGVVGELYLAGAGLAKGYLNQAGMTAERFVANPFEHGQVMYRTGDLVKWRDNGQLDFIGRSDDQVKIRGFRIELGDVESAINAVAGVDTTVVIAERFGESHRLIAYCTLVSAAKAALDEQTLLATLASTLPEYMVPAALVILDAFALNVNGKIDRKALPKPVFASRGERVAPQTKAEQTLCEAVGELLGVAEVGTSDDFFNLGGDSISAMGLGTLLRKSGYELRSREIFAARELGAMAALMQPLQNQADINQDGDIQPLPMWNWFEETFSEETRYVQGVFVEIEPEVTQQHLQAALAQWVALNAACRLVKQGTQYVIAPVKALDVQRWLDSVSVDAMATAPLDEIFEHASKRVSLGSGQLLQLVMLSDPNGRRGLMILAHHLIIDGVSWRIALPQLKALTRAQVNGDQVDLAGEVTGINTWSKALYQHLGNLASQLDHWRQLEARSVAPLKAPVDPGKAVHRRVLLSSALTQAVLTHSQSSAALDIDELLLASVTSVLGATYQRNALKVNVESHGREEFDPGLNLSQTLGWFTTEYPLVIDLPGQGAIPDLIMAVKQAKRSVKDKGLGYMALRYLENPYREELRALSQGNKAALLFNYLGRFEQTQDAAAPEPWMPLSRSGKFADTFAVALDSECALQHELELNIFIDESDGGPKFALNWSWNEAKFSSEEIDAIGEGIEQALTALVAWLSNCDDPSLALQVPAEYTETGITLMDAQAFTERYGRVADLLPALPLQEGLLFQSQIGDENSHYNSTTRLTFQGEVTLSRVQQALDAVIDRHPQLLAKFDSSILGRTVQLMPHHRVSWPIESVDLRQQSAEAQQAAMVAIETKELVRQFDLTHPEQSLLNATLIHHGQDLSTLYLSAHHLVVDGWSTPILLGDFLTAYASGSVALPKVSASYADVVSRLKQRDKTAAEALWRDVLQDVHPTLAFEEVPVAAQVQEHELIISAEKTQQLNQLLRRSGLTMNSLMQGVWSSILGMMTGREDVVFGTPVSGRFGDVKGIDEHVGLFSNTIPVRMKLHANQSLLAQLKAHQEVQIQLIERDELGLGEIQQLAGGETLFDTLLVVENYPDHTDWYQQDYAGARLTQIHNRGYTHYPLTILVLPGEQIQILFEYRDTVGIARQVVQRFENLLQAVIDHPDLPLTQLDLRLNEEVALQQRVNQTQAEVSNDTLQSLMAVQAARTPERIALIDSEYQLTYRDMRRQVTAMANLLVRHGVGVGDIVAVALPRSAKLSLALNSILECGGAYLPLDVSYPDERLAYMVGDAKPKLIITTSEFQSRFDGLAELLILDTLPEPTDVSDITHQPLSPEQGAYIIYTSGSTGNPKGVLVSHQAIVNRLQWMQFEYQLTPDDVVLQKTPCSFDVSVWEFFWPLIQGASLVMAPPESHKDPEWLRQIIDDYKITTLHFVPSMLAAFVASLDASAAAGDTVVPSLQRVFCSGEALSKALSQAYGKWIHAPLHNLYGPTEAAVDVTYCPAFGEPMAESLGNSVPIGLPVWNTQVYVLDSFLREAAIGVPGELYLAGDQLAIGYLNRSALTADRFIANPFRSGERMYRTGDVVRWLPSGKIEYLGRSDDQLKIRGQRIELGEIETALQSCGGVKQALVCAKALGAETKMAGADDRQLVGYVILNDDAQTDGEALRAQLAEHLPAHMVPVAVLVMAEFPLSANGKLDRKALPLPSEIASGTGRTAHLGLETQLAAIFAEVLGIETLTAEDDFFAMGGHSLMAMKLAADIRRELAVPVTVGQIMVNPTVEKLALLLQDEDALQAPESAGYGEVLPIRGGNGPALICINSASGFAWQYTGLPKHLGGTYPIVGLQSPRPDGPIATGKDMEETCEMYMKALKQVQPQGPYYLLGYSFGGTVAHTLAVMLQQQGEEVAFLGLLDTYPPESQDWDGPLSEEVRGEIEREKALFLAASDETDADEELAQQRAEMLQDITASYEDAVRLLSGARSSHYDGRVDLFIARRTLPDDYDVDRHWQPFLSQLDKHFFDCSHDDMIAHENVGDIGEQLNRLLSQHPTLQ
ncbi:non-ribosomal peptide synthetase [Photobacterium sp. TY1-4]|uniref:non-ribosomal peptide synthetase n=1 Tax=Photobacterium sp. TY1-4 TaxID=2899122 RepID=UPI0021C0B9A4|nr:non-ribosomal peptide synthetase [Photobacterium sp. TY1-4]UXI03293.1 amino acid adenylation domain-containing protein [Photobacterium sp. TY1-4]